MESIFVRSLYVVLLVTGTVVFGSHSAQPQALKVEQGDTTIPLWPGAVPDAQPSAGPEIKSVTGVEDLVAGKPSTFIENVSLPTMTVYTPKGKNTSVAVLVFPGGGYNALYIDIEGTEVCDWLTPKGVTCIVVKYRVPHSGPQWHKECHCHVMPKIPAALQDAQRAMSLTRFHAADWHIDPHKIGVLGFSAGGHLVAAVSTHFTERQYAAVDAADKESSRPDFAVAIYPGHLSWAHNSLELNPDIKNHISAQTSPTFLLQNENDPVDSVYDSLSYFAALQQANVPVELHSYATGGHAFGLRRTKEAATEWPQLVERWLVSIGMISK
jgi:acetyl esterase/lipase